jgi:hypothetical protein
MSPLAVVTRRRPCLRLRPARAVLPAKPQAATRPNPPRNVMTDLTCNHCFDTDVSLPLGLGSPAPGPGIPQSHTSRSSARPT